MRMMNDDPYIFNPKRLVVNKFFQTLKTCFKSRLLNLSLHRLAFITANSCLGESTFLRRGVSGVVCDCEACSEHWCLSSPLWSEMTLLSVWLSGLGPSGYLGIGLADPAQCRTHNIGGICVGSVIDGW